MLETAETARLLSQVLHAYIAHGDAHRQMVIDAWEAIAHNSSASALVAAQQWPFLVPHWQGLLADKFSCENALARYRVCATDGSSIEADRHQGIPVSLINIGSVSFSYGEQSTAYMGSHPFLFAPSFDDAEGAETVELFNLASKRTELELQRGFELCARSDDMVYMFDGSLIFWHLEPERSAMGRDFLTRYLAVLQQFYERRVPTIGYISLPKSRELVNVVRALGGLAASDLSGWVDADLMALVLAPWQRSGIFENRTSIVELYPAHLRPHFVYLNVGEEIARVEFPAWVLDVEGRGLLERLVAVVGDQCVKGGGYPIVLAEAHESAVVKSGDRAVFYECMRREMEKMGRPYVISRKSQLKKRLHV